MNLCQEFRYGKILFNNLDQYVGRSLQLYGEYSEGEAELFRQVIKRGDVIVEAGANIGALTVPLAQLAGNEGTVYAFEPQRLVFQMLCANVALNNLGNVYAMQNAVGEAPGMVRVPVLDRNVYQNWGNMELSKCDEGEPVSVVTVDSLELPRCDFIKADVEGMELSVFRGAEQTIKKYQPLIYFEAEDTAENAESFRYLRGLGYELYQHTPMLFNNENYFKYPVNVFQRQEMTAEGKAALLIEVSWNVLAVPKSRGIKLEGFEIVKNGNA